MLAKVKAEPFDDKNWIFETKYDGYRAMALCDGKGEVELYSRNLLSFNEAYAPIAKALSKMDHPCLLDGEVVVEDGYGRSHFQLLQNYQRHGKGNLKYYVFDLLSLDENDLTEISLLQRKELLRLLLKHAGLKNIFFSEHVAEKGIAFFKQAAKHKLEGIMAKKADSLYYPDTRTNEWLKVRIVNHMEAVIAGFTAPAGSREYFGSLLLGLYKGKQLEYIGHCGTGFDSALLKELYHKFKPLFTPESPFKQRIKVNNTVQWLKPELVCQVKFTEWTKDNNLRHPVFLGLRTDKKASEVTREKISV
jgi:bifunctional non-homologous end joining protein LigD